MPYPFSYFSSLISPHKIFGNRHLLTLWQRLFTTIFLIALLVIPSSLQTVTLKTYPLDNFVEGVYDPLTDEVMADLSQHIQVTDGQLTYTGNKTYENITFGDQVSTSSGFSYQFQTERLLIRKGESLLVDVPYQDFSSRDFADKDSLAAAISRVWYQQNRIPVSLSITFVSAFILAANMLFILLGATFFLYLTKKSKLFHFNSFKECYNFSLNCLGLPTIIACLVGFFGQPLTTLITTQNILFVLLLIWVFFKTKFRDRT